MKQSLNILLAASAVLFPLQSVSANMMECATDADMAASADLFPEKVTPIHSQFWNVTYHGSYKIFTNKASDLTYLLYQCGTEPPTEELDGRHAGVLPIPTAGDIAVASTPMISYLELLGLRTQIKGFLGSEALISSPCLLDLIDAGSVSVAPDGTNSTVLASAGLDDPEMLTFVNGWTGEIALNNTIVMEEYQELSLDGTMEWIKVYGAIFNLEGKANDIFNQATCRFDAIEANVASVTSDMPVKPKVVWAYYSDYCGGWDVGECPNYYCNIAEACDAEILNSTEGSLGLEVCGAPYMSLEEFTSFAQDADHWIYPAVNWNSIYAENEAVLSQFKSVQQESVFDYQLSGSNAWFEQRYAEYDVVLNDFCLVAGTAVSTNVADRRLWFRNVFREPVGAMEQCEDPEAPYEPRGNAWTNCGGGALTEQPVEEIPAEMPATEEDAPTEEEEVNQEDEEEDQGDHDHDDEDHNEEKESETAEAPESSSVSMTLAGAACFGFVSFWAGAL